MEITFTEFTKAVFSTGYKRITDGEKVKFFFIFNHYLSRLYPEHANLFNKKTINPVLAMDIYNMMFHKIGRIPYGFFSQVKRKKKTVEVKEEKELTILKKRKK